MLSCAPMRPVVHNAGPVPHGKRTAFGWPTLRLEVGKPVLLTVEASRTFSPDRPVDGALQIVVGLDIREEVRIAASVPCASSHGTTDRVGVFEIRYGYVLQPFRLNLEPDTVQSIMDRGVELELLQGEAGVHVLLEAADGAWAGPLEPARFASVAILWSSAQNTRAGGGGEAEQRLKRLISSTGAVQPFGWMDGAVLDGAWSMLPEQDAARLIERHRSLFTDRNGQLRYEDARSRVRIGEFAGIEYTLPAAAFARTAPDHPVVDTAVQFWLAGADSDGLITDAEFVSAEGCYTVGYPLAVVGHQRKDRRLIELALRQFRSRWSLLHTTDGLHLRAHHTPVQQYRNWARAYAWFMLGLAYAIPLIGESTGVSELEHMLNALTDEVLAARSPITDLWSCFVTEHELLPDSSGSAGIAAALANARSSGLLDAKAEDCAKTTAYALVPFIALDGLLGGVAQSNRGGESLQRSDYRVFSQMGSGLAAQLFGVLR